MQGPVARAEGGLWGRFCARIRRGQWFRIERRHCAGLDIHGPNGTVSLVAWIQRQDDCSWQYIAGIWNHRDNRRQYALYTSGHLKTDHATYERSPAHHQVHGFISDVGGPTPGKLACHSYATGRTFIEKDRWYTVAFSYDGREIRVYVNGVLDRLPGCNPFPFDRPIYDGGTEGGDFTVAQRANWAGYPHTASDKSGFSGLLAGVAVYRRALTPQEMAGLQ